MAKVVLITGASSGIGKATAKILKKEGYIVYGAARRVDKMADLKEMGVNILSMDVTDSESVERGVRQIINAEKRIDVLINNAGFGFYGTVEDVPIADALYQLDVNVVGMARLIRNILPTMRKQQSGTIINMSSIAGKMSTPLGGWYHASKHAVEGLTDSLRQEVEPLGVKVVIIEPGIIKTPWWDIAKENMKRASVNTAYPRLVEKGYNLLHVDDDATPPEEIGELIKEIVETEEPKTRYVKGQHAEPILLAHKLLSDRLFDKGVRKQLGL